MTWHLTFFLGVPTLETVRELLNKVGETKNCKYRGTALTHLMADLRPEKRYPHHKLVLIERGSIIIATPLESISQRKKIIEIISIVSRDK